MDGPDPPQIRGEQMWPSIVVTQYSQYTLITVFNTQIMLPTQAMHYFLG